jgi:hypothetical protein
MPMVRANLHRRVHALNTESIKAAAPLVLLASALAAWAVAMWRSELSIGSFGLVHSLSLSYFAAAGLLSVSFVVALLWSKSKPYLLALHLVCLVAFAHLTPILLEGTPRFTYIYESYGYADYLVRTGRLDLTLTYHNWPALHLLNAALVEVTGIDPIHLLLWSAPAVHVMAVLTLALVSRVLSETREETWLALWIGVLFTAGGGYLVPGTLANLFMITALSLISISYLRRPPSSRSSLGYQVALLVLLVAIIPAHLLTSVALVISLVLTYVLARTIGASTARLNTSTLLMVALACWMLYVAVSVTAALLPRVLGEILSLDTVIAESGELAGSGAPQHTAVVLVRMGYAGVLSLLALLTCVQRLRSERRLRMEWALPAVWVVGAASTVLVTAYSGEILGRALGLAFFALVVLASKQLANIKIPLTMALVVAAALLSPVNMWGNEQIDHVPPSEIAAVQFFYENRPSDYGLVTYPARVWRYQYLEQYYPGPHVEWVFTALGTPSEQHESFLHGTVEVTEYLRQQSPGTVRVYDSGYMEILAQHKETLR